MKKTNIPEEVEAYRLTEVATMLIQGFVNGFIKESRGKGHIEICKESASFVATTRLERKKEAKHEKE